ncbi:MAG TPA: OB-fold domain-containing protein [Acidimicrobiia bacterium]|nr:OB-fold domain-containing protein [Acidimicrobiia bacterium]
MRGILGSGAYLPYRRLDRSLISGFVGSGGGKGTRTVSSYDEDTTTMGVEASRLALRAAPGLSPDVLSFATCAPAYADRTNATAIQAALRLDTELLAVDYGAAVRSASAALLLALQGRGTSLVVSADVRTGLPGSGDEAAGGDGAAALLVGDGDGGAPVLAEFVGGASATGEFVDRWRAPGDVRSKLWEERFGELEYVPLGERAWNAALKQAELSADQVDRLIVTGLHARAVRGVTGKLGATNAKPVDDLAATVGNTGAAHPSLLLTSALETAEPGQLIALVVLADGADVMLFRATDAVASYTPARSVATQVEAGAPIGYGKFLSWRGMVTFEPPRRPEPQRVSSSAAARSEAWKFGFVGSRDRETGAIHLPPQRVSADGTRVDAMDPVPMADASGTIATFTIDRMVYSPSPPVVFAVVDFDGGGRLPIELTDLDADEVAIGKRVEMTFRRLFTADGIHDYFWKGRLVR